MLQNVKILLNNLNQEIEFFLCASKQKERIHMPNLNKTERIPLCVRVYKQIYDKIKAEEYGDKLPGENQLAKDLGVSRSTLRQALAFLHDDGLIKNVHGIGNFIIRHSAKDRHSLEIISNPLYAIHNEKVKLQDFRFRLELDSQYTQEIFGKHSTAVVSCDRWYEHDSRTVGMIFTFLPIDSIDLLGINMQNEKEFYEFLDNGIYDVCDKSELEIKISSAGNLRYKMPGGEQCILAIETLYKDGKVVCHNKIYVPKLFANLRITRNK